MQHAMPTTDGFLPHGYCYLWDKPLLYTHLASDLLIGVAYVGISLALAYLVYRTRRDITFSLVFLAFGLFIVACGMTHFMEVWTLWHATYWLAGGVKVVTAAASVATALAMPFTVPRAITTIQDARVGRDRRLAAERARALEKSNALLRAQAIELDQRHAEAQRMASELEQMNAELREAIAEAEWARTRAEEARQVAETANRAKAEFLAVMSHELRTPLNAIIGYTDILAMGICGAVSAEQTTHLGRIRTSAGHLTALIDQILGFARIESGYVLPHLEPVSVATLTREAVALVEPMAGAKGLRLAMATPPADVVVMSDAGKVRQILINLLSNATKFTDAGTITVRAVVEDDEMTLEVEDTGIGIPPAALDRVFDPFWQVDQTSTRRSGGTGLGLSVARQLARLLGGHITVMSAPGVGSTFTVRLPIALAAASARSESAATRPAN